MTGREIREKAQRALAVGAIDEPLASQLRTCTVLTPEEREKVLNYCGRWMPPPDAMEARAVVLALLSDSGSGDECQ